MKQILKGAFEKIGPLALASIAWLMLLVYPIHIWMTGVAHEAKVMTCTVFPFYDDLSENYNYFITTDFDNSSSQYVCNPTKCPGFKAGKDPTGRYPDAPSCGDTVTVFASSTSGESRVVASPSFLGVVLSGRNEFEVLAILSCALYSAGFVLAAAALFVSNLWKSMQSFYIHSSAKGRVLAFMETVLSTAFLAGISILLILTIVLFFRMLMVSALPSKFPLFAIAAITTFVVAVSPLPRRAVSLVFRAYESSLAVNLRHLIGMAVATRLIFNLIASNVAHDPWSFDHAPEIAICLVKIVLTGHCSEPPEAAK